MSGHNPGEFSMMDLFRQEVETHTETLTATLLNLENRTGGPGDFELLMRAAHSIKGGARIVELDAAVRLAHTLEDCFVTLQKRMERIRSRHTDILLRGVDMLRRTAGVRTAESSGAVSPEALESLLREIRTVTDEPASNEAPVLPDILSASLPEKPEPGILSPPDLPSPEIQGPDRERMVRVSTGKIEQIMGLSGEVVVRSQGLSDILKDLTHLRRSQSRLAVILENLHREMSRKSDSRRTGQMAAGAWEAVKDCNARLSEQINRLDLFTRTSTGLSDRLYHEVISVRMCPFAEGTRSWPRMVRDLARDLGKKARLEIFGQDTEVDRDILEKLDAPITLLLGNAVDHGIELPHERLDAGKPETGTIRLEAAHRAGKLVITVSDDGRGIDFLKLRQKVVDEQWESAADLERLPDSGLTAFLFEAGFTTASGVSEISGRGVGLDVVRSTVHKVGGEVRAEALPGHGMSFYLELPLTLSVIRTFLVRISGEPYAFPLARIERCTRVPLTNVCISEGRQYFREDDINIALVSVHELLGTEWEGSDQERLNVVIVSDHKVSETLANGYESTGSGISRRIYGLVVDDFIGETELVVRPLDPRLGKIPDISAASVTLDGSPVLIFDVEDLIRSIGKQLEGKGRLRTVGQRHSDDHHHVPRILVVDDSLVVREKERMLLESHGYEVEVAVDGLDGWNLLRISAFDLVVSDVDMPRMNGIELVRHIRNHPGFEELPVVIVSYKASDEDRLLGLEVGANYYLAKTNFDEASLIGAVSDLVGEP